MRRGLGRSSSKAKKEPVVPPKVNTAAIKELFARWADEPGLMTMDGISRMAEDLHMDPATDVKLLALCWKLKAKKPSQIDSEEWEAGLEALRIDSLEKLEASLPALDPRDLDKRAFREFFKFVFLFSREGTHRTLEKDIVHALLPIAIGERSAHTVPFLDFLDATPPATRVTLDQWCSFLEFSDKVPKLDFAGYEEDGAWPLLLDEYVEATKKKQAASSAGEAAAASSSSSSGKAKP